MNASAYSFRLGDVAGWKGHLADQGFAVIRGLISPATCTLRTLEMQDVLRRLSRGALTEDPATWARAKNYPFLLHGGMNQYVGHAPFQWASREDMAPVFEEYWQTSALSSSFDGFCYMDGRRTFRPRSILSFVHTDQSPHTDGVGSIQGLLNFGASGPDAGGLVVVPGSHRIQRDFFVKRGLLPRLDPKNNWYLFSEEEKQDPAFAGAMVVEGQPGDAMIWDSRLFHCNTVPSAPSVRAVAYVCMIPRGHVPIDVREKRRLAFRQRRCTAHHPGDGFRVFPKLPRFAAVDYEDVLAVQTPMLSARMAALV